MTSIKQIRSKVKSSLKKLGNRLRTLSRRRSEQATQEKQPEHVVWVLKEDEGSRVRWKEVTQEQEVQAPGILIDQGFQHDAIHQTAVIHPLKYAYTSIQEPLRDPGIIPPPYTTLPTPLEDVFKPQVLQLVVEEHAGSMEEGPAERQEQALEDTASTSPEEGRTEKEDTPDTLPSNSIFSDQHVDAEEPQNASTVGRLEDPTMRVDAQEPQNVSTVDRLKDSTSMRVDAQEPQNASAYWSTPLKTQMKSSKKYKLRYEQDG
ncbi:hypothetical protein BC827DRAFT_1274264 [Russula dissimulans]|nr:hypothetical protein BC827DRAFT_1274264 [Russula dissimulans]